MERNPLKDSKTDPPIQQTSLLNAKRSPHQVDNLPFYELETAEFYKLVTSISEKKDGMKLDTIDLHRFIETFKIVKGWEKHFEENTPMSLLLKDQYFYPYPDEFPDALSADRLLLMGILLCKGKAKQRAQIYWNIVQTPEQETIAASDKDLWPALQDTMELSIIVLRDFAKNKE